MVPYIWNNLFQKYPGIWFWLRGRVEPTCGGGIVGGHAHIKNRKKPTSHVGFCGIFYMIFGHFRTWNLILVIFRPKNLIFGSSSTKKHDFREFFSTLIRFSGRKLTKTQKKSQISPQNLWAIVDFKITNPTNVLKITKSPPQMCAFSTFIKSHILRIPHVHSCTKYLKNREVAVKRGGTQF